ELTAAERAHMVAVEQELALVRDEAAQRAQHARLAGAVRADQHHPGSGLDGERHVADGVHPLELHREVVELDHRIDLEVRRTTAKNGAPKNAVTTPIGSSEGDSTVRATTSVRTRKPPPH